MCSINMPPAFERQKKAEGDDMAAFAYETVQLVCAFIFTNAPKKDFSIEIDYINQFIPKYRSKIGEYREGGLPTINVEAAL